MPSALDRWAEIDSLIDNALDASPQEREQLLERLGRTDPELQAIVQKFLASLDNASDRRLLNRSAGEVFVSLLGDDTELVAHVFANVHGGRYRVRQRVGAGGMATVYLADDTRHDRKVAIKMLHPHLSAAVGSERFLAEIRTMARLQHPHLLPLLDSGEAEGQVYFVMPFVAGQSLRDRLQREEMLPIEEAVRIAREVASALDYAHRHGVVHRDIKPENVLLHEGQALVADWGIALASAAGQDPEAAGGMLGTPHYMAPEQVSVKLPVDGRADIYALGCMLYEMLTGKPPYDGTTAMEILRQASEGRAVSPRVARDRISPELEAVVLTAIARLPADRFQSAHQFAAALERSAVPAAAPAPAVRHVPRYTRHVLAAAVVSAVAVVAWWRFASPDFPPVERMLMTLPAGEGVAAGIQPRVALSQDGQLLAYVGPGPDGGRLWVKRRDQLSGVPLPGTDGAQQPVFSPDGRSLAFLVRGPNAATVRTVPVDGGSPISIASTEGIAPSSRSTAGFRALGLAWGDDGFIYLDGEGGYGPRRVRATGGAVERIRESRDSLNAVALWPAALPGSRGVLATLANYNEAVHEFRIAWISLTTGETRILGEGTYARYAASGHLLYVTGTGDLMAAPFDPRKGDITGEVVKLAEGIDLSEWGAADLAVSATGTVLYVPGYGGAGSTPVWVTRTGRAEPVDSIGGRWRALFARGVALSPDGSRLVYSPQIGSREREIFVKHLPDGPLVRLTTEGNGFRPFWRDNNTLIFHTRRDGGRRLNLWQQQADGATPARRLVDHDRPIEEASVSPRTPWMVLRVIPEGGGSDLMAIRPGIDSTPRPLIVTQFEERVPTLSPDGRYLAYLSTESGRQDVYVRPFPDAHKGRWQISTNGGTAPLWSRDGRELFYISEGSLVAARVRLQPAFAVESTRVLFSMGDYETSLTRAYDEAPDGRFIMFRRITRAATELAVVENFPSLLAAANSAKARAIR